MSATVLEPLATQTGTLLSTSEKRRLAMRLTAAVFSGGLLVISLVIRLALPEQHELSEIVAGVAAVLVGWPVLVEAWASLKSPSLHGVTDQLVACALIAAWVVGDLETAALVPLAMVFGHILEERSLLGSREAIDALGRLTRTMARLIHGPGAVEELPSERLQPGQQVELRAGDRAPADGVITSGHSSIDTSPITGESVPVEVSPGDTVHAGTINLQGRLELRVTRTGAATMLGQVAELMRHAEESKPPITRLLERFAGSYLILVLLVATGVLLKSGSATAMMAVIVASCPCALVLAAPAAAIAAIAVAARHGILVKGSAFLEELGDVDTLILDKTGTVTMGELRLVGIRHAQDLTQGQGQDLQATAALTRLAASIGAGSSHPVSRALSRLIPSAEHLALGDVREASGLGVCAAISGTQVAMGRAAYLSQLGVAVPEVPVHDGPLVGLAQDSRFLGWLLLADEPRDEARLALDDLRSLGLTRQILLTGDRASVAQAIATRMGIATVISEVVPEQKLSYVLSEIREHRRPLVVGDGINDALALKAGAVGVGMGAKGSDIALASADIVLTTSDLRRLATCIRLSRRCRRTIAINVMIGLAWTLLIITGAACGLFGPVVAVVLHNVGTLIVMANAGRLLRFDEPLAPAQALHT
jgi:Cd2+/Zn2+-exporting ATPase